jgi:iron complex outermembrane recepter protein
MKLKTNDATIASKTRLGKAALLGVSLGALMAVAAGAHAQDAAPAPAADEGDVVIVTGFRSSLQTAINEKKKSTDMVDVIKAEDIGQFPDLNLAESLQRIPGVSIDRDGGEGKQITVRGLNSEFSRTRLNGMEAMATTGSKDASGGTNRGRGFDFNVFAADLFNSITVRKSLSAEIEEGSLGATVDLQTARPFDYKGFTMAAGGQLGYNDLSEDVAKRGTFMISNRWADGKLGALFSIAWGQRNVIEDSTNSTRWENAYAAGNAGRFESYSTNGGTSFIPIAGCGTSTSTRTCNTVETNTANPALTGEAQKISRALHPRIPRYNHFETAQNRVGITGAFQMKPFEGTLITLDAMHATFEANRDEWEIEAISFSRASPGLPKTDIYNYEIDDQGTIVKAAFNDVDVRSEHRFDELTTTFDQLNLTWDQNWGDRLSTKFFIGSSKSVQDTPEQTTFTYEAYDVDGYTYDYSDMTAPVFNYGKASNGCTPDQTCYWAYTTTPTSGPALAGDPSLIRIRPQLVENEFSTTKLDAKFEMNDHITFKAGYQTKDYTFYSEEYGRVVASVATRDENAAGPIQTAINSDLTGSTGKYYQTVSAGGNTYLIPNLDAIRTDFQYDCRCVNSFGNFSVNKENASSRTNNRLATEHDAGWYIQADFRGELGTVAYRGNIGLREVTTDLVASGYIGVGATLANPTGVKFTTVERSYKDSLPSFNLMIEPLQNVYVRFAAAKTMARPTLLSLIPGGGAINNTANTITTGNPYLDPVRANTMDLSVEWYPDRDTLFTASLFQKDLKSYIQSRTQSFKLSELGYDYAALGESSDETYAVTTPINTPGGDLKGYEISIQKPFTFLPGFLSKTGGIVNYTHVESQIEYYLTPGATTTTRANLLGLSPEAWNVTAYYEGDTLAGRVAFAYRDGYISQLSPGSSADFWGKNETFNIDAQMTWKINKSLTLILEGINLTDEADDRYISYNTVQGNTAQDLLYDYSKSGRQYYAGFRYKY